MKAPTHHSCLSLLSVLLVVLLKLTIAKQHENYQSCGNVQRKLRFLHARTKPWQETLGQRFSWGALPHRGLAAPRAPEYNAMTWSDGDRTVRTQPLSPDKHGDQQQWIAERRTRDGHWRLRTKETSEWYCLEAPAKAKDVLEMQLCNDDLKSQAWMFSVPQTNHYIMQSASLKQCVAATTRNKEYFFVSCDKNGKFLSDHRPCLFLIEDVIEDDTEDGEPSFMYDPYSVEE